MLVCGLPCPLGVGVLACPTQVLVPVGAAVQLLALCAWRLGWLLSALRAPCVWAWGWLLLALCALPSRLSAVSPGPLRALNKLVLLQREQDSASAKTVCPWLVKSAAHW